MSTPKTLGEIAAVFERARVSAALGGRPWLNAAATLGLDLTALPKDETLHAAAVDRSRAQGRENDAQIHTLLARVAELAFAEAGGVPDRQPTQQSDGRLRGQVRIRPTVRAVIES